MAAAGAAGRAVGGPHAEVTMTKFRPMSENASSGIPWGNAWAHVAGFALLLAFTNLQSLLNIQVPSLPATLALPYNPPRR